MLFTTDSLTVVAEFKRSTSPDAHDYMLFTVIQLHSGLTLPIT